MFRCRLIVLLVLGLANVLEADQVEEFGGTLHVWKLSDIKVLHMYDANVRDCVDVY